MAVIADPFGKALAGQDSGAGVGNDRRATTHQGAFYTLFACLVNKSTSRGQSVNSIGISKHYNKTVNDTVRFDLPTL